MTGRIRSTSAAFFFILGLVSLTWAFDLPNGSIAPSAGSASISSSSKPAQYRTSLTFSDRVAYQYAIEEVYWRHRIWPKENPSPKPPLDEVMSRAQVEKKVEDYLRASELLADRWQRPITSQQLQAEIDRMASHTKQPDVLRELFAALNNDPFVIAECLARPLLSEWLTNQYAYGARIHNEQKRRVGADLRGRKALVATNANYMLPPVPEGATCTDDTWTATSVVNATTAAWHTAVWTGSEMIVWGGYSVHSYLNTGGKYNPTTDSWTATSTTNTPDGRMYHTAVWTGSEMIVWGGYGAGTFFHTGGRYNPSTDSWTPTSTTSWPNGRRYHTAVWTGSEMIVWGGEDANLDSLNTGGRYNPGTDSWTATSTANAASRRTSHTAVWTGSEMIVWGGGDYNGYTFAGGRYNPSTDTWMATSTTNTPDGRGGHTAVWTGREMIVWGGDYLNTGGKYNPTTDSWTATSTTNAPSIRLYHTAVWTGSEMIVWGGLYCAPNCTYFNTGGRYNPDTDGWVATSTTNAPIGRAAHTAVWTGSEMIAWGGYFSDNGNGGFHYLNSGGRYCAQPSAPIVQNTTSRKTHGGAGNFDVALPLTGTPGIECRSGGASNDYTMIVTFSGNVSVTGSPQAEVILGSGCVGSGGVCNGGTVTVSGAVVTIPLTNIANAQTINLRLNGVNSASGNPATDVVIPMTKLLADTNGNGTVTSSDVAQTKARIGQTLDTTNFRSDVNANGVINATDVSFVKSNVGTGLP